MTERSFGFKTIKVVEDTPSCIADRLVWGAVGTLMELDIPTFFEEWTPKLNQLSKKQ